MELKLTRPICFFDLETTGTDVSLMEIKKAKLGL